MDGYNHNTGPRAHREQADLITVEQLRHLVRLLDRSDVSEIELRRVNEGIRLVLRKAKALESSAQQGEQRDVVALAGAMQQVETTYTIVSSLVGIFHSWAKPKGGVLVAIGDRVKAGQLLATIQSLNVLNEVEAPVGGRVVEILVQDGQPVEYGQQLMILDSAEGA